MRIENTKREVETSTTAEVSKATIKATPKLFDMFADQTYANKPVAIMRELVANGVDAHTAAGCPQRPVEVTLPTELDPMCVIQDFGIGMAHDFVMGPFMAYTDGSTKDSSDDQIGGFGIGSKSPFAYVDQFTLRVVHDGTVSIYTMFKDTDGIPAISRQTHGATKEPNGVSVSFPVEADDVQTFRDAAQEALQYFDPMPKIINGEIKAPEYTYRGNGWGLRTKTEPLGVIMGGVRYPVSPDSLGGSLRHDKELSPLLNYGIDITLPIGACGIAMSREQLSYTPKTTESIKAALEGILDDVVKTFATLFDHCKTEWEAMKLLSDELGGVSYYRRTARQELMAKNARYKGRELHTEFKLADNDLPDTRTWRIDAKHTSRGLNCPTPRWNDGLTDLYGLNPSQIECVIFDDMEVSPKNKNVAKMRHYVDDKCQRDKSIIVVRPPHGTKLATVRALFRGCPDIVLTSTMAEPPKRTTASGKTRPKVRMFTYDGSTPSWQPVLTNLSPAYGKKGITELEEKDQPSKGTMVVMDNFSIPADLHARMKLGIFNWSDLVFVNSGDATKIKDDFEDFEKVWQKHLDAELAKHPELAERIAVANDSDLSWLFGQWRDIRSHVAFDKLTQAQQNRPFGRVAALYEQYVAPMTAEQRKLAPFVTAKLPPRTDPEKMRAAVKQKQPKLHTLLSELRSSNKSHVDIIVDYI